MKKLGIVVAFASIAAMCLTGCGKQVSIDEGLSNNKNIKSCAYTSTISVDASNMNKSETSEISNYTNSGKFTIDLSGDMKNENDKLTLSNKIKYSAGGISVEIPLYLNTSTKKYDFNLFVDIPQSIKKSLGSSLENANTIYLGSDDITKYVKKNASEKDYKAYNDAITKAFDTSSKSSGTQIIKDISNVSNSYITDSRNKVQTFAKLDGKSIGKNGTYTVKLMKKDVKAIAKNYINNATYFSNFKAFAKSLSVSSSEKLKEIDSATSKKALDEINKDIDELNYCDITEVVTIEDGYVTKSDIKLSAGNDDNSLTVGFVSKISNINKAVTIKMPDKNAKTTLNVIDILSKSGGITGSTGITGSNATE